MTAVEDELSILNERNKEMNILSVIVLFIGLVVGLAGCGQNIRSNEPVPAVSESTEDKLSEGPESAEAGIITEEQALEAVRNYCYINNPDLKDMEDSEEYTIYWDVSTNENDEIVVLFRSYTGAQIRYYINPLSGDTYVTESVPGITDEENNTDESFNISDYLN